MAERLYLIRVDMERFLGPMTLKEVREAYRGMQFDLHDEVATSNSEWVAFDDLEKMQRYYPEIGRLVQREMLNGWDISEGESGALASGKKMSSRFGKYNFALQIFLWAIMPIMVFGFLWFMKNYEASMKLVTVIEDPLALRALHSFKTSDRESFNEFMERHRFEILQSFDSDSGKKVWLAFVRASAFSTNGSWGGLSPKVLRGYAPGAPVDCSTDAWLARFRSEPDAARKVIEGSALPSTNWLKMLFWDPLWLSNNRHINDGWLEPSSYYEACLLMANKALQIFSPEKKDQQVFESIKMRIVWLLHAISSNESQYKQKFEMSGFLWAMSCIEVVVIADNLSRCLSVSIKNQKLKNYLKNRAYIQRMRILSSKDHRTPEDQAMLLNLLSRVSKEDEVTGFDYSFELKNARAAAKNQNQPAGSLIDLIEDSKLKLR